MSEEKYIEINDNTIQGEPSIKREDIVNSFNEVFTAMDSVFQKMLDCVARCKIVNNVPDPHKDEFSIYILVSNPNVLNRRVAIEYFDAVVNSGIEKIEETYGNVSLKIDNYDVIYDVYDEMFYDTDEIEYDEIYSKINTVVNNYHRIFKHYKNNKLYRFEGFTYNTYDERWEVLYRALYDFENLYTRPIDEFFGTVVNDNGVVCERFEACVIN